MTIIIVAANRDPANLNNPFPYFNNVLSRGGTDVFEGKTGALKSNVLTIETPCKYTFKRYLKELNHRFYTFFFCIVGDITCQCRGVGQPGGGGGGGGGSVCTALLAILGAGHVPAVVRPAGPASHLENKTLLRHRKKGNIVTQ